jgi:hypothetical protein
MFASRNRVEQNTCSSVNQAIERQMEETVARCAAEGTHAINERLAQLDQEWDIERMLQCNFATVVLAGTGLSLGVNRRWALLPAIAAGFMMQHVLQGWCPPMPMLRRMGFRTVAEIDRERYALKALRGDFDVLNKRASTTDKRATRALRAAGE